MYPLFANSQARTLSRRRDKSKSLPRLIQRLLSSPYLISICPLSLTPVRLFRLQAQQRIEWANQQIREKQEKQRREKELDRMYQQRMREIDNRLAELEEARYKANAALATEQREYNKRLAEQKREKEIQDKLNETFNNMQEVENLVKGDLLSENPEQARSAVNPNRVVPYAFKGMSPEQIAKIQEEQRRQTEEKEVCIER